jgi:DNA polymerase-1
MDRSKLWFVDFEFRDVKDGTYEVHCGVALNLESRELIEEWQPGETSRIGQLFHDKENVLVAYYASAEILSLVSIGGAIPKEVLDLYVEFKRLTNGKFAKYGKGLLGALKWFGLEVLDYFEKEEMRELAKRGGPYSHQETRRLIEYCKSDVLALEKLWPKLIGAHYDHKEWGQALLRGRYIKALSFVERKGLPIDVDMHSRMNKNWDQIKLEAVKSIESRFDVFEGLSFKYSKFESFVRGEKLAWPRLCSGRFDLKERTFREIETLYPEIRRLREVRSILSKMKLRDLSIGPDGRNRVLLSPFASVTGRNQPSTSKFIFGNSSWMRGLIKPEFGKSLAYIDWSQQEFGIAAALSGDENMMRAYESGDPYLEFAKLAEAVPPNATKESHPSERALYKECVLATQYGMGKDSLARRIGKPPWVAKQLLDKHRAVFSKFWAWSDNVVKHAFSKGYLETVFDWRLQVNRNTDEKTIRNFPMQANGAEMLRLAIIFCVEDGIDVVAPVHDAIMIESEVSRVGLDIKKAQVHMLQASKEILAGFSLGTDAEIVEFPARYSDSRGETMWNLVTDSLESCS